MNSIEMQRKKCWLISITALYLNEKCKTICMKWYRKKFELFLNERNEKNRNDLWYMFFTQIYESVQRVNPSLESIARNTQILINERNLSMFFGPKFNAIFGHLLQYCVIFNKLYSKAFCYNLWEELRIIDNLSNIYWILKTHLI